MSLIGSTTRLAAIALVLFGTSLLRADVPIVRLWPGDAPATQPYDRAEGGEKVTNRSKTAEPNLLISGVTHPWLSVFLPKTDADARTAVIICPGGGYAFEAETKEGVDVAKRLNADGIAAFVLKYRLPHGEAPAADQLPMPQQDMLRAIQLVRSRAAEWKLDPKRIGVMGFSAGGHLAATAATMYDEANELPVHDAISKQSARPDFAVLLYAVISMEPNVGHTGSRNNLIGKTADATLSRRFSTDEHVTANTPPLFIAQAKDDKTVPFHNAELMNAAAEKAGVPHEFISFDHGGHGFGLGDNADTKTWFPKCLEWLRKQDFVTAKSN